MRLLADNDSILSVARPISISESSSHFDVDFDFDMEVVASKAYRMAMRSNFRQLILSEGKDRQQQPPSQVKGATPIQDSGHMPTQQKLDTLSDPSDENVGEPNDEDTQTIKDPLDIPPPTNSLPLRISPNDTSHSQEAFEQELRKAFTRLERLEKLASMVDGENVPIGQVNSELREKRSTMVVLDTQKEILLRELEVLVEHLQDAKQNVQPLDVRDMQHKVVKDMAAALERLNESYAPQILDKLTKLARLNCALEKMHQETQRSIQDFESNSLKNARLAELNNNLAELIQARDSYLSMEAGMRRSRIVQKVRQI